MSLMARRAQLNLLCITAPIYITVYLPPPPWPHAAAKSQTPVCLHAGQLPPDDAIAVALLLPNLSVASLRRWGRRWHG